MKMFAPLRTWQLAGVLVLLVACGGGKESMSDALAKADKKDQEAKEAKDAEAAKAAEQAKKAKEGVIEHPWTFDAVKTNLKIGTKLVWAMEGQDKKGKPIEDQLHGEIHGHDDLDVKIMEYKDSQKDIPAVMQPQGHPWGKLSPFFHVDQSETKLLRQESVTVPAGTFDCVVAEVTGYFGNHLTVWMIADQPGIYAQVVQHPNTKNEDAQAEQPTDVTFKLVSIARED
ncbi:MAG: hypothetical protein KDK70_36105 [Myxococcales bacterium]|nr:hypothetical protein [Myxococcales bacterium]